jgi:hypothetical protein
VWGRTTVMCLQATAQTVTDMPHAIFLKKTVLEHTVTHSSVGDRGWLYRSQRKKVPEHHSGLRPSEKELLEQRSIKFRVLWDIAPCSHDDHRPDDGGSTDL